MIGLSKIERALLDLGASVNLLSYSIYVQLGLRELKPTSMTLQLANRSMKDPQGIVEDILIKVDKFYFPMDFIVLDTEPVQIIESEIPVIIGRPFLATTNTLINCRTRVMKISFENMTMELNIFHIRNQPLDYDEVQQGCLIEEITNEIMHELSLEDPEMEYFAPDEDDLDFSKLLQYAETMHEPSLEDLEMEYFAPDDDLDLNRFIEQDCVMHEPSLEDPDMECFTQYEGDVDFDRLLELARSVVEPSLEDTELESFAQLGYDLDFKRLIERAEAIFYPIFEMHSECGETTELSFSIHYSSAVEHPNLISKNKWVGPIHIWPRWPSLIIGRKKNNKWFSTQVQTK
jgi:hypothetical protein